MTVWVAIIKERHSDEDAEVFTTNEAAVGYLRHVVPEWARHPDSIEEEELTDAMRSSGWTYYVTWSGEGDAAWVIEKETDPWSPVSVGSADE